MNMIWMFHLPSLNISNFLNLHLVLSIAYRVVFAREMTLRENDIMYLNFEFTGMIVCIGFVTIVDVLHLLVGNLIC